MEKETRKRTLIIGAWTLVVAFCFFCLIFGFFIWIPTIQYTYFQKKLSHVDAVDTVVYPQVSLANLKETTALLEAKLEKMNPVRAYIVINTSENTFKLFKNKKLIRSGICSTGSLVELEVENEKKWVFETPKGVFTVKGKVTNPVWRKPDWAFAEEGLPIPSANDPSRYEYGVLGDFALSIGNGYLIHGTLYQRFLGLAVTHGCVRLNDADLEIVYETLPLGAQVFIY